MFKNKSIIFCLLLVMLAVMITACGSKGDQSSESNKSSEVVKVEEVVSEQPQTRTVKTVNGDIVIPANAKRIVVDSYLPTLLLLDVKPVGATQVDIENVHIQNLNANIESTGENSFEKILALQPDLIISSDIEKSSFEKFSKMAPTIIIPYETYSDVHEEVRTIGQMLGKDKEAEKWLAMFDEKIQQQRERIQAVMAEGETVSIFGAFGKDSYIYGDGIYKGGQAIYKQLQLTPSKRIKKELIDAGESNKQVSFEVLTDYAGDYIFFDISNGGSLDKKDPVWQSIDAVKKENVFYLDGKRFWPYDPIAVLAQAEEVADMLVAKKKGQK
ncbi:ABC transporter substrate-binding protein [Paenibacillus macquariensis]|uniref:Iron complex transport system substrate-binding protein n=1 Tax=Paenibacillus macquariensis TaxID=948756 RepID=A0ABY1K4G1_9BACL|nr:ABC transporter substrate-binding protein [Paenibacillus macquariensis]MEC0089000.1 ABC transporter substrate-binding protein [Paenibacillus macquariensis]OAB31863.1 ABC transporter substrate-binding protein [Paenibacillus macquariensis subsp. macquariensis]SIR24226.1 iron complex transport system substrate-binding protein [Paenibacillus macquariensis]